MSTNVPSTEPEPIYLDDLDPHTQRIIYSAMAQAPERGLGPSALFASRPIPPTIEIQTAAEPAEPPAPEPAPEPSDRRPARQTNFARHEGHCTICNHPERDAIEQAFLHWWRPSDLAYQFNLGNRLVVYRHAHAVGLFERRLARTQHALGYVVEKAQNVRPTADGVIRAVRALGCLDQDGRWREPRKEVLITHQYLNAPSPALPAKDESSRD